MLSAACTLLLMLGEGYVISFALLSEAHLARGEAWRLFTYALPHTGFWHLFFNFLVLWFFSPSLERALGKSRFAILLLFAILAGGVAHVLASPDPVVGFSAAVYAVLLYAAWLWPKQKVLVFFVFPVPLAILVIILGGIEFILSLQGGGGVSHWAHLGGLAAGILLALLWGRNEESRTIRRTAHPDILKQTRRSLRERIGFFLWKRRLAKRNADQARVDALLDKISQEGMASLRASERRFLDRASKKHYSMKN
jgi:membrane associated rhomboid family serine protease